MFFIMFIKGEYIMKNVLRLIKKVILSFVILYTYNFIAVNFNMVIPINVVTIGLITFLGAPSLFALILFKVLIL